MSLGRAGPMMGALSGLDIALWDIRGKLEGVPVSRLLGGAKRTRLECYASLMQYYGNAEHLKRNTTRALEHGYRQIKLHERTADAVAVARQAIGPDVPLMVDTNCAWLPSEAEQHVNAMAASKPYWVEEPIYPPEDFESAASLRRATGVPLAMGENATSPTDFRRMVETGATDFVQPSIVKIGGISRMAKVAAEVEAAGATCVPNVFYIGPGYLAAVHCLAAKERAVPLERMFCELGGTPYAKTVPVEHGAVEVPDSPGLGADPEEDLIAQFRV
jgi:L-alanine-DL-glutamate epimerase-like enolase superfamily enzyme